MPKRGENIYKRKDNRWEARFKIGKHPNGKTKYGYCYGKSYKEVKSKLEEKKSTVLNPIVFELDKPITLSRNIEEWLLIKKNNVRKSTYEKYLNIMDNHILPYFKDIYLKDLSSIDIARFSDYLLNQKMLSPKSVKDILVLFKAIVKYASKKEPLLNNIEFVYPKQENKEIAVLSLYEQDVFISYLKKEMDSCKFGILFALMTGVRLGELCALKWKHISLDEKTVTINSTMQRLKNNDSSSFEKTKIYISEPKSNSSIRTVPLTSNLIKLCIQQKVDCCEAYLLTGKSNQYLEPRTLQNKLKKYAYEAGLNDIHFHILRHTFATRCIEVGFDIKSLSEILGHSDPKVTLQRYVHSSMDFKRENMDKLNILGL